MKSIGFKGRILLISALFVCNCLIGLPQVFAQDLSYDTSVKNEGKYLSAMHKYITSQKLFGYVKELSDSSIYMGRLSGSQGMLNAVNYTKGLFKEWGLQSFTGAPGFIQEFPQQCVEVQYGSGMEILFKVNDVAKGKNKGNGAGNTEYLSKSYPWADGWFAGGTSANGDITADVVYVGYGVTAPELGYDDYAGIDVKGKIILVEGETPNTSRNADTLMMWYNHTLHHNKLANAVKHGAIGMLYKWVPGPNNGYDPNFVYAFVTERVVNDLFLGTGKNYRETIRSIRKNKKPQSFDMGKKAHIKMVTKYIPNATGKNVIGYIKGSDPELCNEYVVISGHLDHLGMIPYHIAGANDNCSATAVLMGAAETLAKCGVSPKRSIIFINVDGEEAGLTGSTYYTLNSLVPKEKVKLIINLEQVGIGTNLSISYGYKTPQVVKYFSEANKLYVHRPFEAESTKHITRPRTDGAVFMKAGYPTADVGTWGDGRSYYHHPKDDWNTMDGETLQDACKLVLWTAILAADE
ncbi:MAG: M28 family peptidase [Bacteroidales bacterium]